MKVQKKMRTETIYKKIKKELALLKTYLIKFNKNKIRKSMLNIMVLNSELQKNIENNGRKNN